MNLEHGMDILEGGECHHEKMDAPEHDMDMLAWGSHDPLWRQRDKRCAFFQPTSF